MNCYNFGDIKIVNIGFFFFAPSYVYNINMFLSDKRQLAECLDIVGEMYKTKFDTKDYCVKPIITENTLNGHLLQGY